MLSRTHPTARRLRALRSDAAMREAEGVFVAEGVHLANEALLASAKIEVAVSSPRLETTDEGRDLSRRLLAAGVASHVCSEGTLLSISDARSPQPIVLIVRRPPASLDAVLAGRGGTPFLVVACGVQDPGNLGALWRTGDAAAATGLLATRPCASLTHARTVRASMGAIFRLAAVEAELPDALAEVKRRDFRVVGADVRGEADYDTFDWAGPVALLLGGEGSGLPPDAEAALDTRVAIPMAPGVESLSVNAAAAVLTFAAARARGSISRAG